MSLGCSVLTHKISSLPLVLFRSNRNLKADISLGQQEGLNANHAIRIHIAANYFLRIEATRNPVVRLKARAGNVDYSATQHISRLGCKDQRQICGVCSK